MISKNVLILSLLALNLTLSFQMKNSKSIRMNSKRNRDSNQEAFLEKLKTIKIVMKLYIYYHELLQENMFNNQAQRKNAQTNFQSIQAKLSHFMSKFKNNKYLLSQVIQEYNKAVNQFNQKENKSTGNAENSLKKPFMWG